VLRNSAEEKRKAASRASKRPRYLAAQMMFEKLSLTAYIRLYSDVATM
jgi:hypothetical protein